MTNDNKPIHIMSDKLQYMFRKHKEFLEKREREKINEQIRNNPLIDDIIISIIDSNIIKKR